MAQAMAFYLYWVSALLRLFSFGDDLDYDDCRKHEQAAYKLSCRQRLPENEPACQNGDDRFKAHYYARHRWINILLGNGLQRKCNTRGENACIKYRKPGAEYHIKIGLFEYEHGDGRQNARHEKLDT